MLHSGSPTDCDALHLRPLCHGACNNPASPAPSLPRRVLDARRRAKPRATAQCLRSPLLLLPRRRCDTAQASENPARLLAACRRLPRHILHRARGFATGFASPAVAVPPAPTYSLSGLSCVLPAACAISFAHGFVGCAGRCPVSAAHRFRACPAGPAGRERPPATALPLAPRQGGCGPLPRRWRARWPAAPVVSGWQHRCSTSCTSWPAAAYLR